MHKIALVAAAVAVLILIGIDAWLSARTMGPSDQVAGPYITISAKGRPTPSRHAEEEDDLLNTRD
jgi:hypothetical protein